MSSQREGTAEERGQAPSGKSPEPAPDGAAPGSVRNSDAEGEVKAEHDASPSAISRANRQAANYRTQRNDALREAHALRHVLRAHNIEVTLDTAKLDTLTIADGSAVGEYAYEAPAPAQAVPNGSSSGGRGGVGGVGVDGGRDLSLEEIREMSVEQINDRWDEVQRVLTG